jgi:O-antigen/teichoic acid export membrane protein
MPNKSQSILKSFGYLLSAHWLREILQAAFMISLARHASEVYGQFMLAINTGQLLLFATEFGLNQHLSTMLARKEELPTKALGQITLIKSAFLVGGWLIMLVFIWTQDYSSQLRLIILIIATAIGLEGIGNSFFVVCQVLGRQDVEGKTRGFASLLGYSYGLASLFAGLPSITIALFKSVETASNLAVVARLFFKRFRVSFGSASLREVWRAWREGLVYTAMALCAIFYNKINMFFLQNYAGSDGVAQYSATWQIIDGISILISSMLLGKVLFPLFTRLWVKNRERHTALARKSASWLVAVALPVCYILFLESDRIITLIYGTAYTPAILMQKQLVGCILLAFIHNLASYLMVSMHRQRILLGMYVTGLIFNVAACALLIPNSPLSGTAYAILTTKGLVALMTVSFCQLTIGLFSFRDTLKLILFTGTSIALYFGASALVIREVAELLGLCPLLLHAYRLYRRQQSSLSKAQEDAN